MSTGNLSREEAQRRAALISGVRYQISLDLSDDPEAATFESTTIIDFTSSEATDTFLDLNADSVESAELNGTAITAVTDSESRLALPGVIAGANHAVIRARCAYQHTGVGMHRVVDPVDALVYLYTHFEPFDAHAVFACFDQPDLKAPFDVSVAAPAEWKVIANGARGATESAGRGRTRHTFATTELISTYLMAVVAGPYHEATSEHNGVALGIYCRTSLAPNLDTDELFEITRQGLDFYADYFQIAYPFGKYDQLFVPEFNMGAMENPGCVTFNDMYVFRSKVTDSARSRRANTILHEMAHMWFGDLVTMRWWDDLWLNESFATYMAHLALDRVTRFDDSWVDLATTMKSWAMRQDQLPSTHPIAADMPDTDAVRLNFDGITYAKGASVLRQLVAWVGDDAFRDGLRDYMQLNKWNNATLADFLAALERSSGRDLASWSQEWLQRAGVNSLRPEIETDNGRITRFTIVQTAPADHTTVRSHHIGIGLFDESGDRLVRRSHIEVDITGERSEVAELVGTPIAPLVLLNDGDLSYSKVRLDANSTATMLITTGRIDDPLARAICWTSLWDMTRDGEMATRDYVRIFSHQAALEQEISTLERFIAQVLLAVDVYGDPRNRTSARSEIHAAAVLAFNAAEPGSDVQLTWARCLISSSQTDAELTEIEGWLQRPEVSGLRIDTDIRWAIVTRLASSGRADAAAIESEAELDPSDSGRRRAVTARIARPIPEAKAEGWRLALEDDHTPLQIRAAAMMGFHQAGQDELVRPYIERYGRALAGLWTRLRPEEAVDIAEGLFPRLLQGDDVLAMADAALADTSLPAETRRIIAEERSGVLRARHAREVDIAAAEGAPV